METQFDGQHTRFENALISTVRDLAPSRAAQVLDFARWLRTRAVDDEWLAEDVTLEELIAEETAWDQVYLDNREMFRSLAREAMEEYETGATGEMIIEDGKLSNR